MNIRNYESRQTHQAWGTGSGSPAFMVLTCLFVNFIALVVTIAINLTVNNDGNNDYGEGTAWVFMAPAPAVGLLWTLIDIVLCRFSVLHPIYYLVESTILMALNIVFGIFSVMFYSWDSSGSWVPGLFILFSGVVYIAIMVISARLVHKHRTRPQSRGAA